MVIEKTVRESDITEEIVSRQVPCAFPEGDEMLKALLETLAKTYEAVFPIQHRIAVLEEKAKPYEKIIKETLLQIQAGTSEEVECTKKIYWDADLVEFSRNDTGEVFLARKILDEDRQMSAEL